MDAFDQRDTPFTRIYGTPVWMRPTISVITDPAKHDFYLRLNEILYPINERYSDEADPFYDAKPTPELQALNRLRNDLHAESIGELPNPDYDPDKAGEQTKMNWGSWTGTAGMRDL
jgi:hypothetical protein